MRTFDPSDSDTHDPSCCCHSCTGGRMSGVPCPITETSWGEMLRDTDHGDECPICECGTVEHVDGEIKCRGECGSVVQKIAAPFEVRPNSFGQVIMKALDEDLRGTEDVIQHFSGVSYGRLLQESGPGLGVIHSLANMLLAAISMIKEAQQAIATPRPDLIPMMAVELLPDGIAVAMTRCADHDAFVKLPEAVEIGDIAYRKSGWNSDRGVAYYRTDAIMGKAQ